MKCLEAGFFQASFKAEEQRQETRVSLSAVSRAVTNLLSGAVLTGLALNQHSDLSLYQSRDLTEQKPPSFALSPKRAHFTTGLCWLSTGVDCQPRDRTPGHYHAWDQNSALESLQCLCGCRYITVTFKKSGYNFGASFILFNMCVTINHGHLDL